MAIWKCDKCGSEFEDFADHEGDSCNQCDDDGGDSGTLSEVMDDYDYSAGELPVEGEDGGESELNRGYQERDSKGRIVHGE